MNECNVTDRQEKHVELDSEICNLESVEDRIKDLLARITGSDTPVDPACGIRNTPTLSHTLNTSADVIRMHNNAMHSLIDELIEILF